MKTWVAFVVGALTVGGLTYAASGSGARTRFDTPGSVSGTAITPLSVGATNVNATFIDAGTVLINTALKFNQFGGGVTTMDPTIDSNFLYVNRSFRSTGTAGGWAFYTASGSYAADVTTGNDGFLCMNEGCEFQIGPDTKLAESGTTILATAANGIATTATVGTVGTGGLVVGVNGELRGRRAVVTFDHDDLTDADSSQDITIYTLPAGADFRRVVMDVTAAFTGGASSDADIICGKSAGAGEYLDIQDVDGAAGTFGDALSEEGTSLEGGLGDVASWSTTQAIVCRFTNAGDTLAALTAGSVTFYIYYEP